MQSKLSDLKESLRKVFLDHGYAGSSIANLAAASDLGKASLYHHFPGGKADMARALVREAIGRLQRATTSLSSTDEPRANLERLLDEFDAYVEGGKRPCLLALFASEHAEVIDHAQLARQFEHWRQQVSAQYEALGASPKAARRRAERLLADLYGFLSLANLCAEPEIFERGMKQLRRDLRNY